MSDWERLSFRRIIRPSWADAMGRDRHGLWGEFVVGEARQKLRWIPPGRFTMGSPEDEPGRFDREGPRHEVVIGQGYWLFDTPCTQALWQAVMGENPSKFQTPDRPVEQVSWDDVQEFINRINERVSGLELTLPSESQWEYACRAGSTTALYSGAIEILGERNAPALDPIAWYGGNSGVDFDLDNGWDSSDWSEKQYPHEKAG
ncbi:MAG: formylglycine-generating enzyme family protein, partial [Magnetococcales bacterium]|nr:formylglycine-generating enzyme family protein [Magnetococcales bacterium]